MFSKLELTVDEFEEYLALANELEFGGGSNPRYKELAERLEKFGVERD